MAGKPFDPGEAGDQRIDDRWTSQKLHDAGYEFQNERKCGKGCGEVVAVYLKDSYRDGRVRRHYLFLETGTLEGHQCRETRR